MMIVYWCDVVEEQLTPHVREFESSPTQITDILDFCSELRKTGKLFVTSTGEGIGSDIVRDGKLPNGQPYTWKKRRI